jgi:HAD superfamily hydrolase (TIGR01490 family)
MHRTAAFFDFDNTLIRGDSQGQEIRFLLSQGWISAFLAVLLETSMHLQARGIISADQLNRLYTYAYKNRTDRDLRRLGETLYQQRIKPRLIPEVKDLLDVHRRVGHRIVIVSASMKHMLQPAAQALKADHLICSRIQWGKDGRATGRPAGPTCIGVQKRRRAEELARRRKIDLSLSWFYSDHHDDLPLLEVVGHPVAVRPTPKLEGAAINKGWRIIELPR